MKIYDLNIPSGCDLKFSHFLVSDTQPLWKELILAGSFASVGNTGLWPNRYFSAGHLSSKYQSSLFRKKESASAWPIGMGFLSVNGCQHDYW